MEKFEKYLIKTYCDQANHIVEAFIASYLDQEEVKVKEKYVPNGEQIPEPAISAEIHFLKHLQKKIEDRLPRLVRKVNRVWQRLP